MIPPPTCNGLVDDVEGMSPLLMMLGGATVDEGIETWLLLMLLIVVVIVGAVMMVGLGAGPTIITAPFVLMVAAAEACCCCWGWRWGWNAAICCAMT